MQIQRPPRASSWNRRVRRIGRVHSASSCSGHGLWAKPASQTDCYTATKYSAACRRRRRRRRRRTLNIDERPAVLHVWDIGGSYGLPRWRNTYLQGSDVLVLAFDASSSTSLNDAAAWICANDADIHARCVKALVANKVDVKSPATYATIEEGRGIASAHGWRFSETSARDGTGVSTTFQTLVRAAAVRAVAEAAAAAAAAAQPKIHALRRERPRAASSRPCCACASCVVS